MKNIILIVVACLGIFSCQNPHHKKSVKVRHFKTGQYGYQGDDGLWYFYILNNTCYSSDSSTQPNFSGGRWMQMPNNLKNEQEQEEEQDADQENEVEVDIEADETDASSVDSDSSDSSGSGDSGGDGGGSE